jgi:hypothetical protein
VELAAAVRRWLGMRRWLGGGGGWAIGLMAMTDGLGGGACTSEMVGMGQAWAATHM